MAIILCQTMQDFLFWSSFTISAYTWVSIAVALLAIFSTSVFPFPITNKSESLTAKLRFASGETPCSPMIESSTASANCLLSITALPSSGIDESLEKPIYNG